MPTDRVEARARLPRGAAFAAVLVASWLFPVGQASAAEVAYSTYLGGSTLEGAQAVAFDAAGGAVVVGFTFSSSFPVLSPLQPLRGGSYDAFVTKFDAKGELVFSTFLGGTGDDRAFGVAVDPVGNVYVVGETTSTNFPVSNPVQPANAGGRDAFVSKISADGALLLYSTYLGGSGSDGAKGVALDAVGEAHVAGDTASPNLTIVAPYQGALAGGTDAFVAKFSPSGTTLIYSTYFGGSQNDIANGIAVGPAGAVIVGRADSSDLPLASPFQNSPGGGSDAFVSRLNPSGSALVSSSFLGGSGFDWAMSVALDAAGRAFVAGFTTSPNFPAFGAVESTFQGDTDGFLTKVDVPATAIVYSTFLGGSGRDEAYGVAVDAAGAATVAGLTTSSDFPLFDPRQAAYAGNTDAFVSSLSPAGTGFVGSTYAGGSDLDEAYAVAVDTRGVAIVGQTGSADFPIVANIQPLRGLRDAFIIRTGPVASVPAGALPTALLLAGVLMGTGLFARRRRR